jgi:hypothetical protein
MNKFRLRVVLGIVGAVSVAFGLMVAYDLLSGNENCDIRVLRVQAFNICLQRQANNEHTVLICLAVGLLLLSVVWILGGTKNIATKA